MSGYTLIEMMIALMLSVILSGLAWSMYLVVSKQNSLLQSLSNCEHQFTAISSMLRRDIAQAGYIGCAKLTVDFPVISNKITATDLSITVKHASFPPATLLESTLDKNVFQVDLGRRFKAGQIVMVSDCRHAEIIKLLRVTRENNYQLIQIDTPLQYSYAPGAEVSHFEINQYYLMGDKLMLKTIDERAVTMAEGLQGMNVSLGDTGVNISLEMKMNNVKKSWFIYAAIPI